MNKRMIFRILCVFGVAVLVIMLFGAYVLWGWMVVPAELTARCDNGVTIWRRDPGAFSSYRYEIRDSTGIIATKLTFNQLKDRLGVSQCLFLGGG